jgi:hypothetical protein
MPDLPYVLLSGLQSAAFPEAPHPGALACVPPGLSREGLAVLVYLHGHDNCVENVVRPAPGRCPPSEEICPAADLIGHLERSGRAALLLVPELAYHRKSSDPGRLGQPGALRALLGEVLERLADDGTLPGAGVDDVQHLVLVSHSGGYKAAAALATEGGIAVDELYLLDSLYGQVERFAQFLARDLPRFAPDAGPGRRLRVLYTSRGGTADHSRGLAGRVRDLLGQAGLPPEWLRFDDSGAPLGPEELAGRLLIHRVETAHSAIPITYMGLLIEHSDLPEAAP